MGEMTDKAKGLGNEIAGNIKQVAGKVTHNQHLEAEGTAAAFDRMYRAKHGIDHFGIGLAILHGNEAFFHC